MTNNLVGKLELAIAGLTTPFLRYRVLRHVSFWFGYYVFFSVLWMKPTLGYFPSFYLEFILMPIRIMAAYCMMYWLIPVYLVPQNYRQFAFGYLLLVLIAGMLQSLFDYFFYRQLLLGETNTFEVAGILRSAVLVNTTVMLAMCFQVFRLFLKAQQQNLELQVKLQQPTERESVSLTLKSNRRIHHVTIDEIKYIEGMGNYVSYHLINADKLVVYSSIKACLTQLPSEFIRLNRSVIINLNHVQSYNADDVDMGGKTFSRGPNITDAMLNPTVK